MTVNALSCKALKRVYIKKRGPFFIQMVHH